MVAGRCLIVTLLVHCLSGVTWIVRLFGLLAYSVRNLLKFNRREFFLFPEGIFALLMPIQSSRSQWPRGLRCRSTAARLLLAWVQIPLRTWMFFCFVRCVLSGRGLLRRAYHSSRRVLPTVARRCVWSRNLVNEEAIARAELQSQIK
jgi:hypothetical protein